MYFIISLWIFIITACLRVTDIATKFNIWDNLLCYIGRPILNNNSYHLIGWTSRVVSGNLWWWELYCYSDGVCVLTDYVRSTEWGFTTKDFGGFMTWCELEGSCSICIKPSYWMTISQIKRCSHSEIHFLSIESFVGRVYKFGGRTLIDATTF